MNGQGIAKVVIVLIVFPVLLSAFFTVVTVPVGFMLTPLFAKAGAWSETLGKVFVGVTFLIALLGSLALCRRLWPRSQDNDAPPKAA